jgi:ADP-ribose pyrophosphatase YjhB (NUDIX family)
MSGRVKGTVVPGFEESYLGQLRALAGNRRLITPAAVGVVRDDNGRLLLIRRSDNGRWSLPAGSMELGESILDCLKREVREETGLEVLTATPFAIYTEPRFWFTNMFGAEHQMFAVAFRVDVWSGTLLTVTDETIDAGFFARDALPELSAHALERLDDLEHFDGTLILK